ncbi:maleylacetoacetate isomerase [Sphingomonas sp. BT-65]|uniref:maleylacetoacetate isomerase n=1 Tax=Sphingomonas sp. BT-65 TaxID=2989821 RepID=UPI0022367BC0|nr:maleylacetoacetate isomerase [Sphingomonas sp. BT-65]MCW4460908.1 maleylacetoacetate isomerase [Sphingomonas sp. BT-65]
MRLHDYWRSGASYRVRIALNLKNLHYEQVAHDLRTGAQADPAYAVINPQRLVPALEMEGQVLTQSLAIVEWLEERHPAPALLPTDPDSRAIVRAMAGVIASDIHPLNNLRVLVALRRDLDAGETRISAWIARWIGEGFAALETMIVRHGGAHAFGDAPGLVDCCLVPQLYSAERFAMPLDAFPRVVAAGAAARGLPAVAAAHPDRQPDADAR